LHNARDILLLPAAYAVLVALLGLGLRLLAGPAQAAFEDLADVLGVVVDAEVAQDQALDAGGGPQVVGPAVPGGAWQQESLQLVQLVVGKPVGTAQGPGVEAAGPSVQAEPAVDGSVIDAPDLGDRGRPVPLADGFDGASSSVFEFAAGNRGTHTT
jgi:hypothetical protein